MTYIPMKQQVANIFTKGLYRSNFKILVDKLGIMNITYSPTEEGV